MRGLGKVRQGDGKTKKNSERSAHRTAGTPPTTHCLSIQLVERCNHIEMRSNSAQFSSAATPFLPITSSRGRMRVIRSDDFDGALREQGSNSTKGRDLWSEQRTNYSSG